MKDQQRNTNRLATLLVTFSLALPACHNGLKSTHPPDAAVLDAAVAPDLAGPDSGTADTGSPDLAQPDTTLPPDAESPETAAEVGLGCSGVPMGAQGTCSDGRKYCAANEYCDYTICGGNSYSCIGGKWVEHALCSQKCMPYRTDCTPASAAFTDLLKDDCTVMVRVSWDATQILGYNVNCGMAKATTQSDALNQLLPMSSINWSHATPIADGSGTGIYAFAVTFGDYQYTAYFSAQTGKSLLMTQIPTAGGPGAFRSSLTWNAAADLGTSCANGHDVGQTPNLIGLEEPTWSFADAWALLRNSGMFEIRCGLGALAVTRIDTTGPEFLFFVNLICPN
jgi:hypothetical protein